MSDYIEINNNQDINKFPQSKTKKRTDIKNERKKIIKLIRFNN